MELLDDAVHPRDLRGMDAPIRHTVSCVGAAVLPEEAGALLLEPHAAAAIKIIGATAVTAATLVSFTAGSPFPVSLRTRCAVICGRHIRPALRT